jgi:5-methylcytosine-specific restriction protein A
MDPLVTNSTQHGFYVVYLFNIKEQIVFLSLNQGVTAVKDEFGGGRIQKDVLEARASIMLQRLDRQDRMPVNHITLSSASDLSESYQWGHVTGFGYKASNLPREEVLVRDLEAALRAYRSLIERNGYTLEEEGGAGPQKVEEKRRLRMHERIERMAADPRKIKKHKGFICEVCDFDFEANYGALGHEFIEAHHLTPIGTLEAGMSREVDIEKDFAVLCANCHRMIHRQDDPSDLDGLRKRLRERIQS